MFSSFSRLLSRQNAAFIAVLAVVFLGWNARVADAGCGDYVLVNGMLAHHEMQLQQGGPPLRGMIDSSSGEAIPCACKGGKCKQAPLAPEPTRSTITLVIKFEGRLGGIANQSALADSSIEYLTHNDLVVAGYPEGVFHPPRGLH